MEYDQSGNPVLQSEGMLPGGPMPPNAPAYPDGSIIGAGGNTMSGQQPGIYDPATGQWGPSNGQPPAPNPVTGPFGTGAPPGFVGPWNGGQGDNPPTGPFGGSQEQPGQWQPGDSPWRGSTYDTGQSPGPSGGANRSETGWGGISGVDPQAGPMDYDAINQFTDQAYEASQRYLKPHMEFQDDRFAQDLINQGIDPNSEAGQKALAAKQRGQNDLQSKAMFDALGFGTGIQDQMFGQDLSRSQLANALIRSDWQLGSSERMAADALRQRGYEFDTQADMAYDDMSWQRLMQMDDRSRRAWLDQVENDRYKADQYWKNYAPQAPGNQSGGGPGGTTEQAIIAEYGVDSQQYRDWVNGVGG